MKIAAFTILLLGGIIVLSSYNKEAGVIESYHGKRLVSSSGAPAGFTGAPGDNGNCTVCHSGSVQQSAGVVSLSFSGNNQYALGANYTLNVTLTGAGAKNGFQIVALRESDNTTVGTWTLTDLANTNTLLGTRNYVTHTQMGNALSSWSFDWQAPGVDEGYVNFYLASNISNNDGGTSGDLIYLSELRIASPLTSSIQESALLESWKVGKLNGELVITGELLKKQDIQINLFDISGKKIQSQMLKKQTGKVFTAPISLDALNSGLYIVTIEIGKKIVTKKIVI